MKDISTITIFYSWQSDTNQDCNLKAIRNALRQSSIDIEAEINELKLVQDEATRNTAGSPDIPATIFQKITNADIFVCDITTINNECIEEKKKTANPNVLIELGYAVAVLGWERIIMLFNKTFGQFPDDVPFDIDRRRILDYSIKEKNDANGKGQLKVNLKDAIATILEHNPLRPGEIQNLTPQEKKKRQDVVNLTKALSTIHIPTLDLFLEDAPKIVHGRIFHFWETFNVIVKGGLFYLYDKTANDLVDKVHTAWGKSLSYGHCYRLGSGPDTAIFGTPTYPGLKEGDKDYKETLEALEKLQEKERIEYEEIVLALGDLRKYSKQLFDHIRDNYLEIDLNETSKHAFEEYVSFHKEVTEKLDK